MCRVAEGQAPPWRHHNRDSHRPHRHGRVWGSGAGCGTLGVVVVEPFSLVDYDPAFHLCIHSTHPSVRAWPEQPEHLSVVYTSPQGSFVFCALLHYIPLPAAADISVCLCVCVALRPYLPPTLSFPLSFCLTHTPDKTPLIPSVFELCCVCVYLQWELTLPVGRDELPSRTVHEHYPYLPALLLLSVCLIANQVCLISKMDRNQKSNSEPAAFDLLLSRADATPPTRPATPRNSMPISTLCPLVSTTMEGIFEFATSVPACWPLTVPAT